MKESRDGINTGDDDSNQSKGYLIFAKQISDFNKSMNISVKRSNAEMENKEK